jgi:hypothetical protein
MLIKTLQQDRNYLLFSKSGPKSRFGSFIRILRQQWTLFPCLVDVLKNNVRFGDHFLVMYQNWNLFVNRVQLQEKRALVKDVFFNVLIINTLELQSPFNPPGKWANPKSQKLHILACHEI